MTRSTVGKPRGATRIDKLDRNMRSQGAARTALEWHAPAVAPLQVTGLPWFGEERRYRRLPVRPVPPIPPAVDELANCPAGAQVRFRSDSRQVAVRVKLTRAADMVHMPATGQCGVDLYVGDGAAARFYNVTKYNLREAAYEILLFDQPVRALRSFTLNLPLYMGVEAMEVGLEPGSRIKPPLPYHLKGPVVVYGTSIVQGGCATRPGMAYTNILGRRLDMEVINLGFSGNGKGEPEVARLVAGIADTRLFILDYEANTPGAAYLAGTLPEFLRLIRGHHPEVPVLVISRIAFARDPQVKTDRRDRTAKRQVEERFVAKVRRAGDRKVFFLDGTTLIRDDEHEFTVDGVHPTDLGFLAMADRLEPLVRRLLKLPRR